MVQVCWRISLGELMLTRAVDSSRPACTDTVIKLLRATLYRQVLLRARISYGNSVCLSVCPSVCLSGVSRPGTESSPGQIETPGFHRKIAYSL